MPVIKSWERNCFIALGRSFQSQEETVICEPTNWALSHCFGYITTHWQEFWWKGEMLLSQPGARHMWLAQIICRFVIVINLQLSTVSHFYLSLQSILHYLSLVYCLAQWTNVFPLGEEQSTSLLSLHLFHTSLLIKRHNVFRCSDASPSNLALFTHAAWNQPCLNFIYVFLYPIW